MYLDGFLPQSLWLKFYSKRYGNTGLIGMTMCQIPLWRCGPIGGHRAELKLLSDKHIPRCYFPISHSVEHLELHGFCDASEAAYATVNYICAIDSTGQPFISLVTAKTKVAPVKRLTIPHMELCGALILARMLHQLRSLFFYFPLGRVHTWTDSTIVLCWMKESPRQLKTFVGNCVAEIVELIPFAHWNHVGGNENPADCV